MQYRDLGRTGLRVSALCLGSMTWGTQNTEAEGHEQIDAALDAGVNFIDTAQMYPTTPQGEETTGDTERIIGTWLAKSGRRDDVILATKVTGEGHSFIRGGDPITPGVIRDAVDASLRRLQTDYIDLYQLHWPNRGSYHFRRNWTYDPSSQSRERTLADIRECLEALGELVDAGKIRHVGLSNETCWGTSRFLAIAAANGLPRIASIQNEYSLLCRHFDLDLAELSHHESVGLLAFSPLAGGVLTGKYQGDRTPPGSRRALNENVGGRYNEYAVPAIDGYLDVARKHDLDPVHMALAFCLSRPFMTSVIFGATSMAQLDNSLAAADLELGQEVIDDIEAVRRRYPMPI